MATKPNIVSWNHARSSHQTRQYDILTLPSNIEPESRQEPANSGRQRVITIGRKEQCKGIEEQSETSSNNNQAIAKTHAIDP